MERPPSKRWADGSSPSRGTSSQIRESIHESSRREDETADREGVGLTPPRVLARGGRLGRPLGPYQIGARHEGHPYPAGPTGSWAAGRRIGYGSGHPLLLAAPDAWDAERRGRPRRPAGATGLRPDYARGGCRAPADAPVTLA